MIQTFVIDNLRKHNADRLKRALETVKGLKVLKIDVSAGVVKLDYNKKADEYVKLATEVVGAFLRTRV